MNSAVKRAIRCIWERYREPLTLTDLAKSAILSRFHFSRVFKEATGVSPVRFLSAVRIYQAKRLLLISSMNVTDISFAVGYNSLGSFTNHFTESVGVSPGRFRQISGNGGFQAPLPRPSSPDEGQVAGTISLQEPYGSAWVYVGVFDSPIVQRHPVSADIVEIAAGAQQCGYHLTAVPEGRWFIHAVAVADTSDPETWTKRALLTGGNSSLWVAAGGAVVVPISLRPRCATDLPILLALPNLETMQEEFPMAVELPVADPASSQVASLAGVPPRAPNRMAPSYGRES